MGLIVPDTLQTVVNTLSGKILTTIPIEPIEEPKFIYTEEEWGKFGELAYPSAALEMMRRNPIGSMLTEVQKEYLRPYFDKLVDRVTIHYGATLLNELGLQQDTENFTFPKIRVSDTQGQTFGLNIYISEEYINSFEQLYLIAHELIHSRQYEQRGSSLIAFGRDYFKGYYASNFVYAKNFMEQGAYSFEERFIEREAIKIVNIAARYSLNGSSADRFYVDPKDILKGYNYEELALGEFDPGEIFFSLDDGSSTATFTPSPLTAQNSIPYNLSATDRESISEAFKFFYSYSLLPSSGNDLLLGNSENNQLFGGAGNDILDGLAGDDQLFGQDGNDQLISNAGFDLLDGGANIDTARYDNDPSFVIVNLDETKGYSNTTSSFDLEPTFDVAAGKALDGFGDVDTLRNLENITGSTNNDILIGNVLQNTLNGLAGNDLLIGNGGNDILDGGDGIDTVSYRRSVNTSSIGVSVDLSTGVATDGIDGLDTLISIENLIGSQFADRLTGSNQANTILGGDGNDIIDGKEGNDRLFGENGRGRNLRR